MSIIYQSSEGHYKDLENDSLAHFKYIKKIKVGSGWRYFYTPEEIAAYQKEASNALNKAKMGIQKQATNALNNARPQAKDLQKHAVNAFNSAKPQVKAFQNQALNAANNAKSSALNTKKNYEEQAKKAAEKARNSDRYKKAANKVHSTTKSINDVKKDATNKVGRGRSKVEKAIDKASKTAKSEYRGAKRAANAVRGKGNNFYSPGDARTYNTYDPKKKRFGKNKKTGRVERSIVNVYRRTHPYE